MICDLPLVVGACKKIRRGPGLLAFYFRRIIMKVRAGDMPGVAALLPLRGGMGVEWLGRLPV